MKKTNTPSTDALNEKYSEAAERADAGDINRIQLEKGENTLRIIDPEFVENYVVFFEDTEGATKRVSMGIRMPLNKEKYAILFDSLPDVRPGHRYYWKALQGKKVKTTGGVKTVLGDEIKLLEVGPSIFKQIAAIQSDPEFGNVHEINLKITKTGEKLKTEYQVMPSPKSTPLPKDLQGELDLDMLVEETPLAMVYEYLGEEYTGEETPETETETEMETVEEITPETESDGFDDLERIELLKYIKKYDLEIVVYKNWTDDEIRNAIRLKIDELQAEEETVEETVEETDDVETVSDDTVVEEDDLGDLGDLDDLDKLEEEKPPVPPKKSKKTKKK